MSGRRTERRKQERGCEGGESESVRRQSPRRLLSISAIDRKECELEELHTALHLLFFWLLLLVHHMVSGDCHMHTFSTHTHTRTLFTPFSLL